MATLIHEHSLSSAWLAAMEHLLRQGDGKDINVSVAFEGDGEDPHIRQVLDGFLAARKSKTVLPVSTVANTIFPTALYRRNLREQARPHLYRMHELDRSVSQRHKANSCGTYFDRLVAYPGQTSVINQLDRMVLRLRSQYRQRGPKSSAYELGLSTPEDWATDLSDGGGELRIHRPGFDTRIMGFPCLSHISLTLKGGRLHLTALYRNQHFVRKAYGNYLGLVQLLRFFCAEVGCGVGELLCVASHADVELDGRGGFGRSALDALVQACHHACAAA